MNFYYEPERSFDYIGTNEPLVYPAHFHKSIELVYINRGTARAVAGGIECNLQQGDFFVAFPEMVHTYDNCHDMDATVIIISPSRFPEYSKLFANSYPITPFIRNAPPEAKSIINYISQNSNSYDNHIVRGMLLSVLGLLFSKMEFVTSSSTDFTTLQDIISYCQANYKTNISIEKMAKSLNISKSCISHTFSNKVRTSFREYINTLRLIDAENLIRNSEKTITEIALESGFETVRTFNRAFQSHYGTTPTRYKREMNS